MKVSFRWRLLEIFSQGEDLESCGGFSWEDLLEKLEDLSDCEPETRTDVSAVHVVTNVLASPSSLVTEFCDGFSAEETGFVPSAISVPPKPMFRCDDSVQ